ncbi:MAG TPA: hypothetical protein ENI23_15835, partial [bacterium]|nr:hypothetical protein [bacterium]
MNKEKKSSNKKTYIIIGIAVAVLCCCIIFVISASAYIIYLNTPLPNIRDNITETSGDEIIDPGFDLSFSESDSEMQKPKEIFCSSGKNDLTERSDIDLILTQLSRKYGLCLSFENLPETYFLDHTYNSLDEEDYDALYSYLLLFQEEFDKYPEKFVENTGLKQIAFVKDNITEGDPVSATPDFYYEVLYYDIYEGNWDSSYQKSVVHHEYYHNIEEEFNGDQYYFDP